MAKLLCHAIERDGTANTVGGSKGESGAMDDKVFNVVIAGIIADERYGAWRSAMTDRWKWIEGDGR